jgi:hypothetical protein
MPPGAKDTSGTDSILPESICIRPMDTFDFMGKQPVNVRRLLGVT